MTIWNHHALSSFGSASFAILWDGDLASMPGWEQAEYVNTIHVPGSDINDTHLMGSGPLTRAFRVLCADRVAYEALHALKRAEGTLRVPAAMNELGIAVEVDYFGDVYAEISDVVLLGLSNVRVWTDGAVEVTAQFQRDSRT